MKCSLLEIQNAHFSTWDPGAISPQFQKFQVNQIFGEGREPAKGGHNPPNFWHIFSFCALRYEVPNKILLLTLESKVCPRGVVGAETRRKRRSHLFSLQPLFTP